MKNLILLTSIFLLLLTSCTNDKDFEKGRRQLDNQGYSSIKNTGWKGFCCDEKDTFSTGFEAKDKRGRKVKGCICSGLVKGITIRFQ